jgi:hypothetical protein
LKGFIISIVKGFFSSDRVSARRRSWRPMSDLVGRRRRRRSGKS